LALTPGGSADGAREPAGEVLAGGVAEGQELEIVGDCVVRIGTKGQKLLLTTVVLRVRIDAAAIAPELREREIGGGVALGIGVTGRESELKSRRHVGGPAAGECRALRVGLRAISVVAEHLPGEVDLLARAELRAVSALHVDQLERAERNVRLGV